MAITAVDINGAPFGPNDEVLVRCKVVSVVSGSINPPIPTSGRGGCGDTVNLLVDTPGNPGDKIGVTLAVSPTQCRRAQGPDPGTLTGPSFH